MFSKGGNVMRKNTFSLTALMAVVSFVCGSSLFSSCSMQKNEDEPQVVEKVKTEYVNKEIEKIIGNTLVAQTLNDRLEVLYNGKLALTASVAPDSLTMTLPIAQHTASTIDGADNHWRDSHGMGFTGIKTQTTLDGLDLTADIMPADPFSGIVPIHRYVTMLNGNFNLEGMATLTATGESKTFSIPVPSGRYFMCDDSVEVRTITETEYQIVYRDTTEYVYIDKDLIIVNGFGYGSIDFTVGQKSFSFRLDLDSTIIHRSENEWGVAKKVDANDNGFSLSDKQVGRYTVRENGINLKSVSFVGEAASFIKLNDVFKYGTATVKVVASYNDESGEKVTREFTVGGSYFHEKAVEKQPDVVTPEIIEHVYEVDTVRVDVKDSEGNLTGQKMRVTIKKDGESWYKAQYMIWETGLANPTLTGTQVGDNKMLRPTTYGKPEEYHAEGWWGEENVKGATTTAYSLQYKFRTAFKAVPGFGQSEESIAETNLIFGKRDFHITDAETGWELSIPAGKMDVKIIQDEVGTDEQAKAEVNGRGLEYEYIGTHYLSFDQYVGGVKVNSQSRAENLLYPKN